jgi:hypothetical protein
VVVTIVTIANRQKKFFFQGYQKARVPRGAVRSTRRISLDGARGDKSGGDETADTVSSPMITRQSLNLPTYGVQ